MALIIVESPTKARTFNRILRGKDYYVFATLGHLRDLPTDKISIDYSKDFQPTYEIIKKKERVVDQLKKLGKKNKEIILATDPDREGESIAYHAGFLLGFFKENWPEIKQKKDSVVKRIVFHEITPKALFEALEKPEQIRINLVKAQQARRILDRIVGYELSPLLWQKLGKNWLSAGRVQTVALRIIVEREKEINKFTKEKYFQIYGYFKNNQELKAKLIKKDDKELEISQTIKLFAGEYTFIKTAITNDNLNQIKNDLNSDNYKISDIKEEIVKRYPPPPFTTSLLQQEGFNRFGFTSKMIMKLAQDLYERGLITYHRTDSFSLATSFVFAAKDYILKTFGEKYALEKPRGFKTRSRSAQEAHEAIRPTKLDREIDSEIKDKKLSKNHKLIYQMIFNRSLATQMKEAEIKITKIYILGSKNYLFEAEFQKVIFDGFLKILNPTFVKNNQNDVKFSNGEFITLTKLEPEEKETLPPPRYTEASLIKILEEKSIGRPSTYAPILSLIQDKGYVEREGRYLKPTALGTVISDYLSNGFPKIFDLDYTASMEDGLDLIAENQKKLLDLLNEFYFPFQKELKIEKNNKQKIEFKEEITENCPLCGNPLTPKISRFGKFYACSTYPKCKFTKSIPKFVQGKKCPKCSGRIVVKYSKKKRRFYGCENYPKCDFVEFSYAKL